MKILFINPPFTIFGGLEGVGGKTAPLNLAYLAAYLRKHIVPVPDLKIVDGEGLRISMNEVFEQIKEYQPDVVGMTMPTSSYDCVKEIAQKVKSLFPKALIVVGGPHPTAFPQTLIKEIPELDFSISGEGEISLCRLITAIQQNSDLSSIPALSHKKNGVVIANPQRILIENLDTIPFPARDLLPNKIYYASLAKKMGPTVGYLANIITSRGCPYGCTYCESKVIWGRGARLRSASNVIEEIKECVNVYGASEFIFHDDILPIDRERMLEICRRIKDEKLDIHWACMTRVNFVWEDVMRAMKDAGCRLINFGFETGSATILKSINKGTTLDCAREAMKICEKIGIRTMGNFMIGNVGETEETIKETIEFAKELNPHTIGVFVATPYPGTDLYFQVKQLGYYNENTPWRNYACVSTSQSPMLLPNLSPERLRYWQARALREFYFRPVYIWKRIKEVKNIKDVKTLFSGLALFLKIVFKKN
jgi:radical SAM superfamily enzyme YgiQ (UPF0313 family)